MSFIDGYKEVNTHFGYFPSFHDDYIESIEISHKKIIMYIKMESSASNIVPNNNEKLKLVFSDIKEFNFSGQLYGYVSVIGNIDFQHNNNIIKTTITTSLGTEGTIVSDHLQIELV